MADYDGYSDSSSFEDPVTLRFGDSDLVSAWNEPARIKSLLSQGHVVTPESINAACFASAVDVLELLLAQGSLGPNARPRDIVKDITLACDDWANTTRAPVMHRDNSQYYPLQIAAEPMQATSAGGREARRATMNLLLRYKPDLFAHFVQRLIDEQPSLPGERMSSLTEIIRMTNQDDEDEDGANWWEIPDGGPYGIRSLLHAMLEDGEFVGPILTCDTLEFDVETRDPQGRTLLHSACRSTMGPDVCLDFAENDLQLAVDDNCIAAATGQKSLFENLLQRGGDIRARDNIGRNMLHHLLQARAYYAARSQPPFIYNTFQYILRHAPDLINSPDNHGMCPLHAALNRVREIRFPNAWAKFSPVESVVQDLLDAGALPLKIDGCGNTALHYLADSGLGEAVGRAPRRALFRYFCDAGVDINVRNHVGRTAIEIFLDNHIVHEALGVLPKILEDKSPARSVEIEKEIFAMFESAGTRWTDADAQGQTLLHWVARHKPWYAGSRTRYLLAKGVDPAAMDDAGRTAKDVADAVDNGYVSAVLTGWLARLSQDQTAQS
jgi:ankyrin repeat protein